MLFFPIDTPPPVVAPPGETRPHEVVCWGDGARVFECETQVRRTSDLDRPSPVTVDGVIVTAARLSPAPTDAAFGVVTVAGDTIGASPRVDETLTLVPGVQLFRRTSSVASNPTTQGMTVRAIAGSGAGRALVTLDGVPQNDPFGGWVLWSGLPSASIEGALVVRGAGAGPYGAGALTGTVQLAERTRVPPHGEYEVWAGERGEAGGQLAFATGRLLVVASRQSSDGWTPVRQGAGAADAPLAFDSSSLTLRFGPDWGAGDMAFRLSGYREQRQSGLVGAESRSTGVSASATVAGASPGIGNDWRLQGWVRASDFENDSVAVGAGRAFTTPANNQFGTPALGVGVNAALRHSTPDGGWEVGADVRYADGETRERFRFIGGTFTRGRIAGGSQYVAGVYGETWRQSGDWLLTGGVRLDRWASFSGERAERDLATGLPTLTLTPPDQDGWQPTARAGLRRDIGTGYLRTAGYVGFRPPTLNELHRPFRVGNDVTEANAALEPEKLYGLEFGFGGDGEVQWNATLFANRLEGAVTNVTVGFGPGVFPVAGFIPAGGVLRQRQNAGDVDALGLEAEISGGAGSSFSWRVSGAWTRAEVDGGTAAPQLTGLRPAQTPELSVSAEAVWRPTDPLTVRATLRYEGERFDDDLNLRELSPATTIDLRADWRVNGRVGLYAAVENLSDTDVETGQTADGTESFDMPRTIRVGLIWRP